MHQKPNKNSEFIASEVHIPTRRLGYADKSPWALTGTGVVVAALVVTTFTSVWWVEAGSLNGASMEAGSMNHPTVQYQFKLVPYLQVCANAALWHGLLCTQLRAGYMLYV